VNGSAPPRRFADSHAHLGDPAFASDEAEAVARARAEGCARLICIGEAARPQVARDVAARHPDLVWWTCGVHPHEAAAHPIAALLPVMRDAVAEGACAIGECGLDYHYDHAPRDVQRAVFGAQIALAADTGRPLVVHSREAAADTIAMLHDAGSAKVRGVLHCHTGPPALTEAAIAIGWYVSFAGVVTFRSWQQDALLRDLPADRLLVESDSPYLAPVPHRGRRNEPAWVARTLERVAAQRGDTPEALGECVLRNTERLFGPTPG
jgi:TatD DNase family protein